MELVCSCTIVETIIAKIQALASKVSALCATATCRDEVELHGLLELLQTSHTLWTIHGREACWTVTLRVSSIVYNWWIVDFQNSANQLALWCEAVRARQPLDVHYAEDLQSGILPKVIFLGEQPRKITRVVVEQLKILEELMAVFDKMSEHCEKTPLIGGRQGIERSSRSIRTGKFSPTRRPPQKECPSDVRSEPKDWRSSHAILMRMKYFGNSCLGSCFGEDRHQTSQEHAVCKCRKCRLAATQRSKEIDLWIQQDAKKTTIEYPLVLVGFHDSTDHVGRLLLQLHKSAYELTERCEKRSSVLRRAYEALYNVLYYWNGQNSQLNNQERAVAAAVFSNLKELGDMTECDVLQFEPLWKKYATSSMMTEESCYYLNHLSRLSASNSIPTNEDISHLPFRDLMPKSSLHQIEFSPPNPSTSPFRFTVLSTGYSTYTKRYMSYLSDIKSFIFPVDLTFQHPINEDGFEGLSTLMTDAVVLFEHCVNSKRFEGGLAFLWLLNARRCRDILNTADQEAPEAKRIRSCLNHAEVKVGDGCSTMECIGDRFLRGCRSQERVHILFLEDDANIQHAMMEVENIVAKTSERATLSASSY